MNKEFLKSVIEVKDPTINAIVSALGTMATCLIGEWDMTIRILAILIVGDYITGLAKGSANKQLSSSVGFKGLLKKGAIFLVIILAHQIDLATKANAPIFKTMCIYFYIGNEGLSLSENLAALGIPLPGFLNNVLKSIQDKNNSIKRSEVNE